MSNQAIALGVAAYNESRKSEVSAEAERIIGAVREHQSTIEKLTKLIVDEQEKVRKLAQDVVKVDDIVGAPWAGELNINQKTIVETIENINKNRQDMVQLNSQSHINRIEGWKKDIKNTQEGIAKLREEMNNLALETVTASQVMGQ